MLAIQNYNRQSNKVLFKGETQKQSNKETVSTGEDKKNFKTNTGLKVGVITAGLETLNSLHYVRLYNKLAKSESANKGLFSETMTDMYKGLRNRTIGYIPVFIAVSIGIGTLVDKAINTKRNSSVNTKNTEPQTNNKNKYQKYFEGKYLGPLTGAVAFPLLNAIKYNDSALGHIKSAAIGATGGLILGWITDFWANKNYKKHTENS